MPIKFACAECGAKVTGPDSSAGKRVKCPKCRAAIEVPEPIAEDTEVLFDLSSAATPQASRDDDQSDPVKPRKSRRAKPVRDNEESGDAPSGEKLLARLKIAAVAALLLLAVAAVGYGIWKLNNPTEEVVQSGGGIGPITPSTPPPTPLGNRLIELPLPEPEPIRNRPEDRIVYFESPPPFHLANLPKGTPLFSLEIYRQAALLAARDELGLAARDQSLGELAPDVKASNMFSMRGELNYNAPRSLQMEEGPAERRQVIWKAETNRQNSDTEYPIESVKPAEAFSRGGFLAALQNRGLTGRANRIDPGAEITAEAKAWLGEPSFESQFAAARDIHRTIREKGESPRTLGELSRAYAHLGVITELQWDAMSRVFHARSLLYAERLVQREPESATALWYRAYARALMRFHADAMADLAKAETLRGETAPPVWLKPIEAFCKWDVKALEGHARAGGSGWDRLLHYLSIEHTVIANRSIKAARECLEAYPDCQRVRTALSFSGGVINRHSATVDNWKIFTETFPKRVGGLPGLPEKPKAIAAAGEVDESELLSALRDASARGDDDRGLSWAVLARYALETRFLQVDARMEFLKFQLAVPTEDYFDSVRAKVADHPMLPYLELYNLHHERQKPEYTALLERIDLSNATLRQLNLMRRQSAIPGERWTRSYRVAVEQTQWLPSDSHWLLMRQNEWNFDNAPDAFALFNASPYCPLMRGHYIRAQRDGEYHKAKEWAEESKAPEVYHAVGEAALARGKFQEAAEALKRAIELFPEPQYFRDLAKCYLGLKDEVRWLDTMKRILDEEDHSLIHSEVRVEIAKHYMERGDFERAKPYAVEAAKTGSGEAMITSAYCEEELGHFAEAEEYMRAVATRYDSQAAVWYFWCLRTGRGDGAAAQKFLADHIRKFGAKLGVADLLSNTVLLEGVGKGADAAQGYVELADRTSRGFYSLLAYSRYDSLMSVKSRDAYYDSLHKEFLKASPALVLLHGHAKKGGRSVPAQKEIDEALSRTHPGDLPVTLFVTASFLKMRSQRDLAKEYLAKIPKSFEADSALPIFIAALSREIDKK